MNSTETLVIGGRRGTSVIGQPQEKVLYALFVQFSQIQLCNIEAFLISAKNQEKFKRIPVRTNGIAAQVSLDRQIVCEVLRQKSGEIRCCPLQSLEELRKLRKHFPELWEQLRDWDKRTWRTFLKNYSVEQLETRFALEEERFAAGLPIKGKAFFDALHERLKEGDD